GADADDGAHLAVGGHPPRRDRLDHAQHPFDRDVVHPGAGAVRGHGASLASGAGGGGGPASPLVPFRVISDGGFLRWSSSVCFEASWGLRSGPQGRRRPRSWSDLDPGGGDAPRTAMIQRVDLRRTFWVSNDASAGRSTGSGSPR